MASSYEDISFSDRNLNGSYRVWNDETVNASITLPDSFDNVTQFKIKFKPRLEAKFEVNPEGINVPEYTSRPLYYRKENGKAEVKIADDDLVTQTTLYNAVRGKQDQLIAGEGITISGPVISATGGGGSSYTAGAGINIDSKGAISVKVSSDTSSYLGESITVDNNGQLALSWPKFEQGVEQAGSSYGFGRVLVNSTYYGYTVLYFDLDNNRLVLRSNNTELGSWTLTPYQP